MTDKELDELLYKKAREIKVLEGIFDFNKLWEKIDKMEKESNRKNA